MVRIDHILAGPGWQAERCWVGPDVGSPHRPVIADLIWTGPVAGPAGE
jgi:endonuclease/exonuclease/phosphatase (EEP) superfamily protein YafD